MFFWCIILYKGTPENEVDITDDVYQLGNFLNNWNKDEIQTADWVYNKIQFPPVLQSTQLEKDLFIVRSKSGCFLYVSHSMTLFINTVYLVKMANMGVTLEFLLVMLLLSVMYLFPAQEPGCMGVTGVTGVFYCPLSVVE